ncbi:acetyl/propionyl/methylcrotonyl-CoA carboxylase subunit alpha [Paraliomyxa miuraensis]|uniref:acetyl/propionyl/methylcrotonyl-CoA carboxylase subunit alpha n=1 Tax=Paraliomyxa miuraensis TaxID=376150 RepID=UPI00225BBA93|nr:biotin carboxylase N-terminal domain-containing protein [Paraliomyxa miuraensis]MCX4242186.1 biotin/lipoyl-binding protein [Paraliomyxa miuraensis]
MAAIRKLLIANRAEIARRVIRSARDLGIRTVAVYSDADEDAPHVREADEAVRLGPGPVGSSYLDLARIMDAAARTGADALHPGYGFLSENGDLARACADAGVTFVGPPEAAIRLMGDKVQAKRRMLEAGVPTAPGYVGEAQDEATLLSQGERIGVPLLVKAVAGGGGRGMRVVRELAALPQALASASSEARSAFGRGDVFLERLIEGARHVEIQVFADQHGHVIHLGERECSAQRRHQKVIEEAPSPAVDDALRARMGEAAVAAARAIDYVGAGTVEFLLDAEGRFHFLEMNTRLQVEHPVTELCTGLDLVALQLRVAEGEPLPLRQDDVRLRGHAIEARIYAEDPYAGFAPQLGRILSWRPRTGAGLRVDDGVESGQTISPHYDAMVAKLIAHGDTREQARRRLVAAVRDSVLLGPGSNRSFLLQLLEGESFVGAAITTDAIDRWLEQDPPARPRPSARAWAVAAVLCSTRSASPLAPWPWRSAGTPAWPVVLHEHDQSKTLRVRHEGEGRYAVEGTGAEGALVLRMVARDENHVTIEHDGVRRRLAWAPTDDGVALDEDGAAFTFAEPAPRSATDQTEGGDGEVRAPIGGRVAAVLVAEGDSVTRGQPLLLLEAMKMEHRVPAPIDGRVERLAVAVDEQVAARQVLAQVQPVADESQ